MVFEYAINTLLQHFIPQFGNISTFDCRYFSTKLIYRYGYI